METFQIHRLKTVHQRLYEFRAERSGFYNQYLGKFSPENLKATRLILFIFYLFFAVLIILAMVGVLSNWYYLAVPAIVIDAGIMVLVFRRTDRERQDTSLPGTFGERLEVEKFLKKELGLKKKDLPGLADTCYNLSQYYKRNYYRWDIPMGFLAIIVTVLCLAKNANVEEMAEVAAIFAMGLFALWNGISNFADTMDRRSDRYFNLYLLLEDFNRNAEYFRLREEHNESLRLARESDLRQGVDVG